MGKYENKRLHLHYNHEPIIFMKKYCIDLEVLSVEQLNGKYALVILTDDEPLPEMIPGQFVEVRVDNSPSTMLRRPISIHYLDRDANGLWLLVAGIGDGTRRLCGMKKGEKLNCVFPLGNGFSIPRHQNIEGNENHLSDDVKSFTSYLLVGGGVGVAPLYFLGSEIKKCGYSPTFLIGARTASDLLELDRFKALGRVFVTTEDGSEGEKGFVTNHSLLGREHFDMISTCGPKPMMMAVARYANKVGSECEVSLENRMACGVGACLCCVENTTDGNVCVCKDGPVFNTSKLLWQN